MIPKQGVLGAPCKGDCSIFEVYTGYPSQVGELLHVQVQGIYTLDPSVEPRILHLVYGY